MTEIEGRIRALEEESGMNKESITIIIERTITNNPRVLRGDIELSEERGDEIYEHTVIINPGEAKK